MTSLVGFDPMAVGTSDLAQSDLSLGLCDRLTLADVACLDGADVVEVKRDRVFAVTTIDAPHAELVVVQPSSDSYGAVVSLRVDPFPIPGTSEPLSAPDSRLLWIVRPNAGSILASSRAEASVGALREERRPAWAGLLDSGYRLPRGHRRMIPNKSAHPCKPDIFAATYEEVA